VHFYDSKTLKVLKSLTVQNEADAADESKVKTDYGHNIITKQDARKYLRIYLSSTMQDKVMIDALSVPMDEDESGYDFEQLIEVKNVAEISIPDQATVSDFEATLAGPDDLIFGFGSDTIGLDTISTFKSCDLASRYVQATEGDEYEGRSCEPCPEDKPYSGGL